MSLFVELDCLEETDGKVLWGRKMKVMLDKIIGIYECGIQAGTIMGTGIRLTSEKPLFSPTPIAEVERKIEEAKRTVYEPKEEGA